MFGSGTVLHFLVRLPPYTQMFLEYQDSSFDIPDRTFHSMETTFRLSCYSSTTDVKELIPEFFFLPEFLCNLEGEMTIYEEIFNTCMIQTIPITSSILQNFQVQLHMHAYRTCVCVCVGVYCHVVGRLDEVLLYTAKDIKRQ